VSTPPVVVTTVRTVPRRAGRVTDWLGPEAWSAVALSLRVSFWATLASLPLGILVALALARWRFPGKQLLNGLVHLPLILPPVVTGYLLLLTFGRRAPVGAFLAENFGVVVAFRWTGAALAAGIMAFPLMVRAIRLAIEAVDPKLEAAAGTLGAPRPWVFCTVTLPLILPGVIAGAILAFAKAMGEFGATITFVSNIPGETQTLPSAIYAFLQVPGGESAAMALVLVSIAVAMTALALSEFVARRVARWIGGA
jgi:molybdate transport system permease protein